MSLEATAQSIVKTLVDAGFIAYFAGGWVRDHLLGIPCSDIDIATNAPPNAVMGLFSKTVPVGIAFGSVVVVEGGHSLEVTTFRSEAGYADGRHPDQITFSTPEEDARRRGLTINGMFYDPLRKTIIDLVGGERDLRAGIIRAIGDPHTRFEEDRLRMIRAARFATRFGFTIEPETAKAIAHHAPTLFPSVAIERVWQEFDKIHAHPRFPQFLALMDELSLLRVIFPEIQGPLDVSLASLARFPNEAPLILQLMQLFQVASSEDRLGIGTRLKASKQDLQRIRAQSELQRLAADSNTTQTQWAHFYAAKGVELLLAIEAVQPHTPPSFQQEHQKRRTKLAAHIARIARKQPLVTADHLRAQGIQPGKHMGQLLRQAEQIAIECDLETSEQVLRLLNL